MPDNEAMWSQAHEDFGALSARVNSTEQSLNSVARRMDEMARDNVTQFANINRSISDIADRLSSKIDNVNTATSSKIDAVNIAAINSRQTNWTGFISASAAVAVVVIGIGAAVIAPINSDLNKLSQHLDHLEDNKVSEQQFSDNNKLSQQQFNDNIKSVTDALKAFMDSQRAVDAQAASWSGSLRDRLKEDEDAAVSQRQVSELKDRLDEHNKTVDKSNEVRFTKLENHVDGIDQQLIKRPEIEAMDRAQASAMATMNSTLNARVDAVTARMNSMQAQLESIFPPSKIVDQLWNSLSELRTQQIMPFVAPYKPPDK